LSASLPIIDLAGIDLARIGGEIRKAAAEIGFFYVKNHGVPKAAIEAVFAASHQVHALPAEAKARIAMNRFHRGYMGHASSLIVTSTVDRVTRPNASESYMMMHELPSDDPAVLAEKPLQGPNPWPAELPGFRDALLAYDRVMEDLARRVTRAVAVGLGQAPDFFDPAFARPTKFLRLLHYPPYPDPPPNQFGSAPHTDYGFLTFLAQSGVEGLQVRLPDGGWVMAPPIEDWFVVNIADLLSHWTGGLFRSTPHRVLSSPDTHRYSVAYFFDMDMEWTVEPLQGLGSPGPREPIRYGDYLMERLDKNYRYRQAGEAGREPAGRAGPELANS
jgi:isopenicillin N synthase-like dioxygenase